MSISRLGNSETRSVQYWHSRYRTDRRTSWAYLHEVQIDALVISFIRIEWICPGQFNVDGLIRYEITVTVAGVSQSGNPHHRKPSSKLVTSAQWDEELAPGRIVGKPSRVEETFPPKSVISTIGFYCPIGVERAEAIRMARLSVWPSQSGWSDAAGDRLE